MIEFIPLITVSATIVYILITDLYQDIRIKPRTTFL
jgi:hypothetical protein